MSSAKKIHIKQVRSLIGRDRRFRKTLQALGLGRVGTERTHVVSPALSGMIRQVQHVVTIHEIS